MAITTQTTTEHIVNLGEKARHADTLDFLTIPLFPPQPLAEVPEGLLDSAAVVNTAGMEPPYSLEMIHSEENRQVLEDSREWAKENEIYLGDDHFNENATMSLYLFPYADKKTKSAIVRFYILGYFMDEFGHDVQGEGYDEDRESIDMMEFAGRLRETLQAQAMGEDITSVPGDEKVEALLNISSEVLGDIAAQTNSRFVREFLGTVFAHWHTAFTLKDRNAESEEESIRLREKTGGMETVLALNQAANRVYLDKETLEMFPEFTEITQRLVHQGGILNEAMSHPKEVYENRARMNHVAVVQEKRGCSVQEAMMATVGFVNYQTDMFDTIHDILQDKIAEAAYNGLISEQRGEELGRLLLGFRHIEWANYAWQKYTIRYNHPDHTFVDKRFPPRRYKEPRSGKSTAQTA